MLANKLKIEVDVMHLKYFMEGERERMEDRKEDRLLSVIKSLAVIKSISSVFSDNIKGRDSKGYQVETLPRRQWNLKSTQDQFWKCQSIFFFSLFYFGFLVWFWVFDFVLFFSGFLYQDSKASRWIYWNPELNRYLVPAVAGQNYDHFQTGKEKKTHPSGALKLWAPVPHCFKSLHPETLILTQKKSAGVCKGL